MTYYDEMIPGYLEGLRKREKKRLFCHHQYKKIMTVEDEMGQVNVYTCNKCGDRKHIKKGEESSLPGEIVQ